MSAAYPFVPYHIDYISPEEMIRKAEEYYSFMDKRRSVREFSDRPVPREVVERIIQTASTAPSGAHKQPWSFCVVSNKELKKAIREAAEKEEFESYHGRMTPEWIEDLAPLGTDWQKPFLETAPWIIVVFKKAYDFKQDGVREIITM